MCRSCDDFKDDADQRAAESTEQPEDCSWNECKDKTVNGWCTKHYGEAKEAMKKMGSKETATLIFERLEQIGVEDALLGETCFDCNDMEFPCQDCENFRGWLKLKKEFVGEGK